MVVLVQNSVKLLIRCAKALNNYEKTLNSVKLFQSDNLQTIRNKKEYNFFYRIFHKMPFYCSKTV